MHVGGAVAVLLLLFAVGGLAPSGEVGLDGSVELKPDSGGELGLDWDLLLFMACCASSCAFGVELVRAILDLLEPEVDGRMSVTGALIEWARLW